MKDEEKIKKARDIICHDCRWNGCDNDACPTLRETVKAIELGLTEGRPKWHDLRKDPDDLPKDGTSVLLSFKSAIDGTNVVEENVYRKDDGFIDLYHYYQGIYEEPVWYQKKGVLIAWCELPKFEE